MGRSRELGDFLWECLGGDRDGRAESRQRYWWAVVRGCLSREASRKRRRGGNLIAGAGSSGSNSGSSRYRCRDLGGEI
jgi:hypothetical protein